MRAIRRTIDGVTYDTGAAEVVHRAWAEGAGSDAEVELILYRSDEGLWFEVCRGEGQLYGALRPLSEAEAAHWRRQHGAPDEPRGAAMAVGEASAALLTRRWSTLDPVNG